MNIVFDLGGVVFKWQPDELISHLFTDKEQQQLVKEHIFQHADWAELDRGTLSLEQATKNGVKRTGLSPLKIRKIFDSVPKALAPIPETIALLDLIKDNGNDFYILSNMQKQCLDHLKNSALNWEQFKGVIFSCEINFVKPEKEIYEYLLTTHMLIASDTVFIDDMEENLIAAEKHGIKTIHFKNADQCYKELQNLGFI